MTFRWGIYAAAAVLALTAAVGVASASETRNDVTIQPGDDDNSWSPAEVRIDPGDTVTWTFGDGAPPHNVRAANDAAADPGWKDFLEPGVYQGGTEPVSRPFPQPGTYRFVCQFHPAMQGAIIVGDGGPIETSTQTPTHTPTATPTAIATPYTTPQGTPPDHGSTLVPGGVSDTVDPSFQAVRARAVRRGANVRITLSEPATVTLNVRRRGKVVKTMRVQAGAGPRTVRLRGLRSGKYSLEMRARDAMGNLSATKRVTVRAR